jgi:hypothetical protein
MQLLRPHATEPQEFRQRSGKRTKWDERIRICRSRPSTAFLEATARRFHGKDNIYMIETRGVGKKRGEVTD